MALALVLTLPAVSSAQSLPSGWSSSDIGSPALTGSVTYSSGTYTVQVGGADIWGTSDQFRFVYRQLTGDGTIVARVASVTRANDWSKAGVMIRESLSAGAKHGYVLVSAGKGLAFQRRRSTSSSSVSTTPVSGVAPYWVRLERRGSTFTASRSTDGATWTTLGTDTISMAATVYVGLAVTSHTTTARTTARLSNVTLTTATTPVNTPPSVSLTAPASGATYTAPATIAMTATASDSDGTISGVDFYNGSTLVGTDTTSPYSYSWSNVPAGSYSLTAVARDNSGGATRSSARTVTVRASTSNQPPSVSLTSPASGATFNAGATITLGATASDADGTVSRVDFYAGSTLLASDTTSPYSGSWTNVAAGTYSIMAVARDNAGATTNSSARTVIVNGQAAPTTAVFVPSSNDATAVSSYLLKIYTSTANPATATALATQNLGKPPVVSGECRADISATIASLPSGTYIATVSAVGPGGTVQSTPSSPFSR